MSPEVGQFLDVRVQVTNVRLRQERAASRIWLIGPHSSPEMTVQFLYGSGLPTAGRSSCRGRHLRTGIPPKRTTLRASPARS